MNQVPGISGSLFPQRFLAEALDSDGAPLPADWLHARLRQFRQWWHAVEERCGPATGLRALFDLVAMPLFGMLGFRARDAVFDRHQARAWLATRQGTPVGLLLLPWADRPSASWRDVAAAAGHVGAAWAFLLAPPFLTLVDARGHAARRELEITLPDALEPASFPIVWRLMHQAAFDAAGPADPWSRLERLVHRAAEYQHQVGEDLQQGVAQALATLTAAILAVRRRRVSRAADESSDAAFDEALAIVYRILFLLFAESRELVPVHSPIYARAYAMGALGRVARRDDAIGLWDGLAAITRLSRTGCQTADLIVRPFNGRLFSRAAAPTLETAGSAAPRSPRAAALDEAARQALVALVSRESPGGREEISYADLGVEQLGSVYERVLDLERPRPTSSDLHTSTSARPARGRHSARRKQTGTFYTPRALAEFVVRRTLAPLVDGAPADAILRLRVVDPAMGSGAFLVAACRFLAGAYERALVAEGRAAPADLDDDERADIRRLVAERCLAGVDRNPVAVQLARLSLWLATLAHGKPLSFLDHRLRTGDSLIGASPADLARLPGRRVAAALPLFEDARLEASLSGAALPLLTMTARRDDQVADVRAKEALWRQLTSATSPLAAWRRAATLWCARWFWPTGEPAPNDAEWRALFDALLRADATLPPAHLARRLAVAEAIGERLHPFHWPLEFADVFYDQHGRPLGAPGFDAVIGNPPWEMLRHGADGDAPDEHDRRALVQFVRDSGLYPACDRGHLNLYQPFVERALSITRPGGRVGLVLPWGLATDDGASALRRRLIESSAVDTLVGLDNAEALFPVHRGLRFMVLTTTTAGSTHEIRARFGVTTSAALDALPGRRDEVPAETPFPVRLTPDLVRRVGGSALRWPDVRRPRDLTLVERLMADFPPLGGSTGWRVTFGRELNATEDQKHFGTEGLPVLEGKHLLPFHTRDADARWRIERGRALRLLPDRRFERPRLGYRDVSGVGNRVSLIAAVIPAGTLTTHTIFCLREIVPIDAQHVLCALLNSYVLNAIARMLMGGHLTTSLVEGLPVPAWRPDSTPERGLARLASRLAASPDDRGLEARLQAEVARLYGLRVEEFDGLLEGFPLVPAPDRARAARMFRALTSRTCVAGAGPGRDRGA